MAEGDRLGALHMGEAGHDGGGMAFPPGPAARACSAFKPPLGAGAGVAQPKPEIRHHLVVARAGGVQPSRRRAGDFGQPRLDVQMDVFQRPLEGEFALRDLLADGVEALKDCVAHRPWK